MSGQKLLTVSVAAYNGAATLAKALDSCLAPHAPERLEVLVVDDGSTDETAAIAQRYEQTYPGIFRLIRQQNGGYGTTINRTIREAKGRYYRTLDCDDWFSPPALQTLLEQLEHCRADAVVTNYQTVCGGTVQNRYMVCDGFAAGRLYETGGFAEFPTMEMHALTFRTETLRRADIRLPPHCNYTDMLYTFCAMTAVQTVAFCPVILYNYLQGREGQSVSLESYRKHIGEYMQVAYLVCDAAAEIADDNPAKPLCLARAAKIAQEGIELLLRLPTSTRNREMLKSYDTTLCTHYPAIAGKMRNKNTCLLRVSGYAAYGILSAYKKRKYKGVGNGEEMK